MLLRRRITLRGGEKQMSEKTESPQTLTDFNKWVIERFNTSDRSQIEHEVRLSTLETGQSKVCNCLEINGLWKDGEPIAANPNVRTTQKPQDPVDAINFDIIKIDFIELVMSQHIDQGPDGNAMSLQVKY